MSSDTYSFEVADTTVRSYALDANELYEYPSASSLQPLQTCALTSEIKQVEAPWSSGNQFIFDSNFGKTQFISNCVRFDFTVPLTITLNDEASADITAANFMAVVFKGQEDICYSQYSFMQGLNTLSIDINSSTLMTLSNLSETFNQIAPYYRRSDVNEWFHASQPDRFSSFEDYTGVSGKVISYIDGRGNTVSTTMNPLNEANIFASKYQDGYTSRTPAWTFVGAGPGTGAGSDARKICHVKASFWIYLPLTFGSVPDKATALSGIKRLAFTFGLKADIGSHLFNIKQVGGAHRYSSIVLNTDGVANSSARMICQVYSPPQFMRAKMTNPATGIMMPYSISCPRIVTTTGNTYQAVAPKTSSQFNINMVQSAVVPKSIYVSLQRVKKGDFQACSTTPINYGLITDMSVSIDGARTVFPSLQSLLHLCDTNSYDELDPVGRLLKGAPIRLDVGKDLSLPEDLIVGQAYGFNFEITGNFTNQGSTACDYKLLVTVVTDSTIDFNGDDFSISSGAVIDSSVLNNKNFLQTQYSLYQRKVNVLGGGFFSDAAKWVGKNAVKLAKNAWENREKIANTVGDVMGLVKTVRGGAVAYNNVSGGSSVRTMGAGKVKETVFK